MEITEKSSIHDILTYIDDVYRPVYHYQITSPPSRIDGKMIRCIEKECIGSLKDLYGDVLVLCPNHSFYDFSSKISFLIEFIENGGELHLPCGRRVILTNKDSLLQAVVDWLSKFNEGYVNGPLLLDLLVNWERRSRYYKVIKRDNNLDMDVEYYTGFKTFYRGFLERIEQFNYSIERIQLRYKDTPYYITGKQFEFYKDNECYIVLTLDFLRMEEDEEFKQECMKVINLACKPI